MYRGHRIAVVIPAHNEARLLPVTLGGLPDFVDLVLVVDDASTDATAEVVRTHPDPRITLCQHEQNQGVGGAIVTGYRRALVSASDLVVVVGADAQMDPAEMPALLDPLVDGHSDYVKGDRLGHPEVVERMPWVRLMGNRVLSHMTTWATGCRVRDSQCGYAAITRSALAAVPLDRLYPRYGFPNDLLARLTESGARVLDRPVTPIYGDEESGIRILRVILPISWLLMRAAGRRFMGRKRVPRLLPAVARRPEN